MLKYAEMANGFAQQLLVKFVGGQYTGLEIPTGFRFHGTYLNNNGETRFFKLDVEPEVVNVVFANERMTTIYSTSVRGNIFTDAGILRFLKLDNRVKQNVMGSRR